MTDYKDAIRNFLIKMPVSEHGDLSPLEERIVAVRKDLMKNQNISQEDAVKICADAIATEKKARASSKIPFFQPKTKLEKELCNLLKKVDPDDTIQTNIHLKIPSQN